MSTEAEARAIQERLAAMQEAYKAAPVGGGYADELDGIEDGEGYQGRIEAFEMFPGKKDPSALYLKTIASFQNHAEYGGRQLTRLDELTDPDKLQYLKGHLHALGVDVEVMELSEVYPGSPLLSSLNDVTFVFDVYTNKKGYRNWAVRQRIDGEGLSDLGPSQSQIAGFEQNAPGGRATPKAKPKGATGPQQAAYLEKQLASVNKPANCSCSDPSNGRFDDKCVIPGHGLGF